MREIKLVWRSDASPPVSMRNASVMATTMRIAVLSLVVRQVIHDLH
jgi:hypothetical protein